MNSPDSTGRARPRIAARCSPLALLALFALAALASACQSTEAGTAKSRSAAREIDQVAWDQPEVVRLTAQLSKQTTAVRQATYADTRMFTTSDQIYSQASFGHMVGYQAGYYGYLWSLVYASDMFSRFDREGVMNTETGRAYRALVLAPGGTREALELVTEFLGREPNSDAFLEHLGLRAQ